jgi:uncharacterized protein YndB with AHSA1/START domain
MSALAADREMRVSRVFDAPIERVWEVWTDGAKVTNWWGPRGFTTTHQSQDLRPGGVWRFVMHGPDGADYQNLVTYVEVDRPRKLVYHHGGEKADEFQFTATITFEERGGQTEVTLSAVFPTAEGLRKTVEEYGAIQGAEDTLSRLSEYIAKQESKMPTKNKLTVTTLSDLEILLTRDFDAPRELVFEALTKPEHIVNWFGYGPESMSVCEMDFRVGGRYRFVVTDPSGGEYPFTGEILEIDAPGRMVQTQVYGFEPFNQFPATVTLELIDLGGRTRMNETIRYLTKEARDAHLSSEMEEGAGMSLDRLEEIVIRLKG